jgi:hypothetical protein
MHAPPSSLPTIARENAEQHNAVGRHALSPPSQMPDPHRVARVTVEYNDKSSDEENALPA